MNNFYFPARFKKDPDGGYVISFRDLPEAISQGESIDDCLHEAADCLEEAITGRIDDNLDIPESSKPQKQEKMILLPVQTAIKAALYFLMYSYPLHT